VTKSASRPTSNPPPLASPVVGLVSLVGAGPGDPGLITVAGLERLGEADVIVYDRLASPRLLEYARPDVELIFAGKQGGGPHWDQATINALLVDKARQGKRVVRLKGGDPFVFGRGGEEAQALRAAGVPFEVVPGVTSAAAVPAYAGIPVTHRGVASSFAVITGHDAEAPPVGQGPSPDPFAKPAIAWDRLATAVDTLVLLMGTKTLPDVVAQLVAHGRSADTPVAVIRWGTTPEQRTVVGTLSDIARRVEEAGITPPAIAVVGEVVRLRETLSWFEKRPLFGKRVLITRTRRQASALARLLAAEGAVTIELPTIEIEPLVNEEELSKVVRRLGEGRYGWVVFTSENAVDIFFGSLWESTLDARILGSAGVAAIGPETAEALAFWGINVDLVPDRYVAEGLVEAFEEQFDLRDQRVLLPRAEGARDVLVQGLRKQGAKVEETILYRSAVPHEAPAEPLRLLREGGIDIVTLTSSSTVRNLAAMMGDDFLVILSGQDADAEEMVSSRRNLGGGAGGATTRAGIGSPLSRVAGEGPGVRARRPLIACIGPITADTARELGLRVDVVAPEHTVPGLVRAITQVPRKES